MRKLSKAINEMIISNFLTVLGATDILVVKKLQTNVPPETNQCNKNANNLERNDKIVCMYERSFLHTAIPDNSSIYTEDSQIFVVDTTPAKFFHMYGRFSIKYLCF